MNAYMTGAVLVLALLGSAPVSAQAPASADKKAGTAATDADMDKFYAAMQERYKRMQQQMERLSKTQDPKERQKILEEHWTTMHEGMGMMMGPYAGGSRMGPGTMMGPYAGGGHMGPGMMMGPDASTGRMGPGGGMGPGARGGPVPMSPEMMTQRQRYLEQRMDMMQMMMDQMLQHQGTMRPWPR